MLVLISTQKWKSTKTTRWVPIVTIGGGLASFGLVNVLRVNGVARRSIVVLGPNPHPYDTFVKRCHNSGIDAESRLRSDSSATPGNIWGWPTFGMRELFQELSSGHGLAALKLTSQLFCEPIFCDHFSPKLKQLTAAIDRECRRIDYQSMHVAATVESVIRDHDSWLISYRTPDKKTMQVRTNYVHIATGYQSNRYGSPKTKLKSLLGKRYSHVYEPHDQLIDAARRDGGLFVVRGRGIAASRAIERLLNIANDQPDLKVIHLMSSVLEDTGMPVKRNRNVQPFNFPKSSFGGSQARQFVRLSLEQRRSFLLANGKTSTTNRRRWHKQMKQAEANNQYEIRVGNLRVDGQQIQLLSHDGSKQALRPRGIIDATGLTRKLQISRPLKTLLEQKLINIDENGLILLTNKFEAKSPQLVESNLFLAGTAALGGPYAPVDSFNGINFASQIIGCEIIARKNVLISSKPHTIHSSWRYSSKAWLRWAAGANP